MKLELAPCQEEQSTRVIRWGPDSSTLNSIFTKCRHLEPIVFLPVITTQLFSKI